jgi:hypothetical protein
MAITFITKINQVDSNSTTGVVDTIHYSINAVEGDNFASSYGTVNTLDCDPLLNYSSLTEAACITCVEEKLDMTSIHNSLTNEINEMATPSTTSGLPWE